MPNWNEVLNEIQNHKVQHSAASKFAVDIVRRKYLQQLHAHTKRNVIAYYSGWLSKPGVAQSDINDEDKNGFMTAVHKLDRTKGLDLILHTPGGSISATQSIVNYLQNMFHSDIRAIVPQIAMSAGTIIACCCRKILMGSHSNLGPMTHILWVSRRTELLKNLREPARKSKQTQVEFRFGNLLLVNIDLLF